MFIYEFIKSFSSNVIYYHKELFKNFLNYFFHCTAWGPSYTYMYTFFFLPFILLRYKHLDIVFNATQQDLIVNPFQEQ